MDSPTESTNTKRLEEIGWKFLPPNNYLSADGTRSTIVEDLQPTEVEGLNVWKAWLIRRESKYETLNEQTLGASGATLQIQLAEADTEIVLDALINPPDPTPDLIAALRRHR